MPTENDLRDALRRSDGDEPPIDTSAVISRARRRRAPRRAAVAATFVLAVIGLGYGGVSLIPRGSAGSTSSVADADAPTESAPEIGGSIGRAPADKINLCTGPLADIAPSATGLVATASFPGQAPAGGGSVTGEVTLTNTGSTPVVGTTGATASVTLSQGGIVLWHTNGPTIMMAVDVDLDPGESLSYPATFEPVRCGIEDDESESFRADLPAVAAGEYDLTAAVDFVPADGSTPAEVVTGPTRPVTLTP